MRFTTRTLIVATVLIALALVLQLHGLLLLYLTLTAGLLCVKACSHLVNRLRLAIAVRLIPRFHSRRMLPWLRFICGKRYAAWALCKYASDLCGAGRYDESIAAHTRALALEAKWADYWAHRGVAYFYAGNLTAAEHDFAKAIALDRDCQIALAHHGRILLHQGRIRQALVDLWRVQCRDTWYSSAIYARGYCHEHLGHWQAARDDYRLAHELDPSETHAAISLAWLQASCPVAEFRDGAKAVHNAHRMCVQTSWQDHMALSVLAAAHAEQGSFEQATRFASQALELAPDPVKPSLQQLLAQFKNHVPFRIPEPEQPR
jgi:tetratricopeptide (TPR) repeat protein